MKLNIQKAVTLFLVLCCIFSLALPAYGAQQGNELKGIKATVKLENPPSTPEIYQIVLTPDKEGTPMPAGAKDGAYILTVKGAGTAEFSAITYPKLDVYHYTIKQRPGANKRATYDKTVYHLTVYVTNAKDGGVEVTPVLTREGKDEKPDSIVFKNTYPVNRPDTPKTNDESNFPMYLGLSAASIAVLVLLFLTRRREENEA